MQSPISGNMNCGEEVVLFFLKENIHKDLNAGCEEFRTIINLPIEAIYDDCGIYKIKDENDINVTELLEYLNKNLITSNKEKITNLDSLFEIIVKEEFFVKEDSSFLEMLEKSIALIPDDNFNKEIKNKYKKQLEDLKNDNNKLKITLMPIHKSYFDTIVNEYEWKNDYNGETISKKNLLNDTKRLIFKFKRYSESIIQIFKKVSNDKEKYKKFLNDFLNLEMFKNFLNNANIKCQSHIYSGQEENFEFYIIDMLAKFEVLKEKISKFKDIDINNLQNLSKNNIIESFKYTSLSDKNAISLVKILDFYIKLNKNNNTNKIEDYIKDIKKQKNIKTWEEYDLLEKIDENTYKVISKNNSREWYVDFCQKNNYYFTYSTEASIRFENRQNSNIILIEYHKQNIDFVKFDEKYFQDFFNKVVDEFKITRPIYFDKYLTKQVGSKTNYKQKCIELVNILENEKDILDWFK